MGDCDMPWETKSFQQALDHMTMLLLCTVPKRSGQNISPAYEVSRSIQTMGTVDSYKRVWKTKERTQ